MQDCTNPRSLVDPQLWPMLDGFPPFDLSASALPATRQSLAALLRAMDSGPGPTRELRVPGPAGGPEVRLLLYEPEQQSRHAPVICYLHGGGMVMGSAGQSHAALWRLAHEYGAVVASVDYRLAPETPYPGPLEDCFAGLQWLAAQAPALDAGRIVVMGESAGGGLAASLALLARDRGGPAIRGLVLSYPMLDHRSGGPEDVWRNPAAGHWIWTRQNNQHGWRALQGGKPVDSPGKGYFSAALADELAGLPPIFIGVGALDLFVDEDLDFARRLVASAVPVELHLYAAAPHGFDMLGTADIAQAALRDRSRALRQFLSAASA